MKTPWTGRLMIIVGLAGPLGAQAVYYLPQVIDGATAGGSVRSTIVLTNPSTSSATVNIALTRDDGSPLTVNFPDLGSGSQLSVTLKPNGTRILQSDGSGDGSAGAAKVSASVPIGVSSVVSAYDAGASLVSESGTGDSALSSGYVIPVDSTAGVKTGVALFNPNATASALTFTLLDTNGATVETATGTLAAGGHLARLSAGDLFPDLSNFRGTMRVSSTVAVAAVAFRQNASAPGYTLLQPEQQAALPLWHYFPQVADGASGAATLQTSFQLYNLSQKAANVTVTLSQDSAAPWVVNIPGLGSNNVFTVKLAPGGSAFLQTDGQGAYMTGAAAITSDQPVGAAAVLTATDGNGIFLSETGMGEAVAEPTFLLAVDTTNNRNSGAAFFNPTSQPLILHINLLDTDGNLLGSTQSQPLAPGGHLAAYVSDWFPGTSMMLGTLAVSAGDDVGAQVAAAALRQNSTALALASVPASPVPLTGAGINVTPALDSARTAKATITPAGGSLSLTDAQGNKFILTIPAKALINSVPIVMTPVTSLSGLPSGASFNAGVQLEPDGLLLFQPALLSIQPASVPAPDDTIPIGWHGTGQGVYLNVVQSQSGPLTMVLTHFSGAALVTGTGADFTSQLLQIGNRLEYYNSLGGYWTRKLKSDADHGNDLTNDFDRISDLFKAEYPTVNELMQLALDSQDDGLLECASAFALMTYERQREYITRQNGGEVSSNDARAEAISEFVQTANQIILKHARVRCDTTHDPLAGLDLLGRYREFVITNSSSGEIDVPDVSRCSPDPILSFQSEMMIIGHGSLSPGLTGDINFDGQMSARVTLTGTPPAAQSLDGYASFKLTGSGPLKYDSLTLKTSSTAQTGSCTSTLLSNTGSTLTVQPNSEIKYQFTPKFQPQAVIGHSGRTIASFCPAYDKSPVSVSLLLDPGMPQENSSNACRSPDMIFPPIPLSSGDWKLTWAEFHPYGTPIAGWQIPGANSFAHREFSQSTPMLTPWAPATLTEKTKLDLNQP